MANINNQSNLTKTQQPMHVILASNGIKQLGESLQLTPKQLATAHSQAFRLSNDSKLKDCDKYSLIKFCFESARYNFTRDDCIYPVPYGNKVQAQMGYKGLREIALQAGYKDVNCVEVYSCDKVYRDKETGKIKVEFNEDIGATKDKEVIGYFAYAIEKGENTPSNTLYWDIEKIKKHGKHYSKTYNSVWGDEFGFDKMAKKTLIKQLCNELRSTPLLQEAIKQDQIVYGGENQENAYLDNPEVVETESKEVEQEPDTSLFDI